MRIGKRNVINVNCDRKCKEKKTLSEIKYRHLFNSRVVFYNFI
jgi:hypothetical protein